MMPFTPPVTCQESEALRLTEAVKNGKQLTHTELRELRRLNRAALRAGPQTKKQTPITTDTSESLRPTSCSQSCASNKTTKLDVLPEQHHSRSTHRTIPMDGESSYTKSESPPSFHQTRPTNVSDKQREKEAQINFPPPHDPVWKEVNEELKVALPQAFPHSRLRSRKINDFSSRLDLWLHKFCKQRFGLKPPPKNLSPSSKPPKQNKQLEELRKKKKTCRAAYKALVKDGLQGSEEAVYILSKWKLLLRQHNRLRLNLIQVRQLRASKKAAACFRKDPNKFAENLFKTPGNSGDPAFSAEEAEAFFPKTYSDQDRSRIYSPLGDQPRPDPPRELFRMDPPTVKEIRQSARKKRNGAAPGLNALTYVLFKKCPALLNFICPFFVRVWTSGEIPSDWAIAFTILLAKSDKLHDPSEFRPITITCTMGKIFFSILSDRLQAYMLQNSYIIREIQKGFLTGVAGCLEHAFALYEALREAKEHTRQIVTCWIDLANAYGSVRHNLIQFALRWYHVPEPVCNLILNYYEKLMTKVQTTKWTTGFFLFDIGLFQGCVLSTILFDCVFQLLLDFLAKDEKFGYNFKGSDIRRLTRAYADDLNLTTSRVEHCQMAVHKCELWLGWTNCMKAKPKKCISMAMKQFDHRIKEEKFKPVLDLTYSPFDPELSIDGTRMAFILNPELDPKTVDLDPKPGEPLFDKDMFEKSHFKFLGRQIHFFVKEKGIQRLIENKFQKDIETVDKSLVNGIMKAWLYQFYVLSRLSWHFLVHDLNHSLAERLTIRATAKLKKWLGIYSSADIGILYRPKSDFGLGLTSVVVHFEKMQIVKCELLKNSVSGDIKAIYARLQKRQEKEEGRKWRFSKHSSAVAASYNLKKMFPSQVSKQGLGNGNYKAVESNAERRKGIAAEASSMAGELYIQHAHQHKMQKAWLHFSDYTEPFDLSWKSLLYKHSPSLVKFVLHASINWVRTPDLLKIWGLRKTCFCCLCGAEQCTLHHILANCQYALKNKRYTWRHDSVLKVFQSALTEHLAVTNSKKKSSSVDVPYLYSSFVSAGCSSHKKIPDSNHNLLSGATDWQILVDFDSANILFPPDIFTTSERPDIIIWSPSRKKVILIELTCPAEEGIANARSRKLLRYANLVEQISNQTEWNCTLLTAEVGVRGFVASSTRRCMRSLGIKAAKLRRFLLETSEVVARCSFSIYLSRENKVWQQSRLLEPSKAPRVVDQPTNTTDPPPPPTPTIELPSQAHPIASIITPASPNTTQPKSTPQQYYPIPPSRPPPELHNYPSIKSYMEAAKFLAGLRKKLYKPNMLVRATYRRARNTFLPLPTILEVE